MNKERLILFILATAKFTHIMDFMVVMPLGPQLMRIFGISPQQFGLVVSAYTISAGLFGFIGAFFVDRFDRKKALIFCYTGFVIGTMACALSPNYEMLVLTRSLTGAFGGVLGALVLATVGDLYPEERRAGAMSIVMAAFSAAAVIGVPFGLFLAASFSWHAPFYFLGGMGVLIWALMFFYLPEMKGHLQAGVKQKNPKQVIGMAFGNFNARMALILISVLMLGQFTVIPYIADYMVGNMGFEELDLTYIYLIGGALTLISAPLIGRFADRYGKFKVFSITAVVSIIPLLLITHVNHAGMGLALVITSVFFVFISGRMIPAMTMITSSVKKEDRGAFMSMNSAVQQTASGLSAFIGGAIILKSSTGELFNYQYVGYFAVAFTLIGLFVASRIKVVD